MNQDSKDTKSIAFVHHKGGTGKTTACVNIAGCLAKMEKRVLVVDLDPQANATAGLGIDRRQIDFSLYDALFNHKNMKHIILETDFGVHVAPSSIDLLAAETHMSEYNNPTRVLGECLEEVAGYYDYILMDVPPGSTMLMMNGIAAADSLIVPIDAGIFGVETMDTLRILLRHMSEELGIESDLMMVLLREYPASLFGENPTKKLRLLLGEFLQAHHYNDTKIHTIPFSTIVFKAQMEGIPISHLKPYSDVGRMFKKVTKEILKQDDYFKDRQIKLAGSAQATS